MHSFITNKTLDFMSFTIKRGLIFPVKLFVIWQQGKKSSEMWVCTSPIPANKVRCKMNEQALVSNKVL